LLGFAYLAYFGFKVKAVLKQQGLNFDEKQVGSH
jgi:hypothetical protein